MIVGIRAKAAKRLHYSQGQAIPDDDAAWAKELNLLSLIAYTSSFRLRSTGISIQLGLANKLASPKKHKYYVAQIQSKFKLNCFDRWSVGENLCRRIDLEGRFDTFIFWIQPGI
jgi:hypothetical protein